MQQRLIMDMDGVLADVYQQFIKKELAESGVKINIQSIHGLIEKDAFPNCLKHVNERGFFLDIPVMEGSIEVMQKLNTKYELFVVSSATEYPFSLEEKHQWLYKNFPFLSWKQLVLCGSKQVVKGDIMVDDHFKNLDYFTGRTILFTQAHNINKNGHKHERVNNWHELEALLL